jgi:hypothetical protein
MDKIEIVEDVSFLLYMVPILLNGIYALFLWFPQGIGFALPSEVYLKVTKDPVIFLAGFSVICIALLLETQTTPKNMRAEKVEQNISRIRILAFLSLALSIITAWSATGYSSNFINLLSLYTEGRYAMIYPALLLGFSFLIHPSLKFGLKKSHIGYEVVPLILFLLSPVSLFILWRAKLNEPFNNLFLVFPIILLIIASVLFVYGNFKLQKKID